ncbi:hypothetical protein PPERSA_00025 [Pseudocohnilembus persalinus]|uniref:Alpha-ketoglutarate-dependent dioxygenase AlkB-like domain-containing protein n=1 Tax=Pseudocohnilembus persalinus TaxID=266149 RepID=A0A0V0QVD4_PSEPJ|nr:hypothetical protein PPERSA_00025 [Pseudocohnilembus persalinus]|eukprot:KRX06145.1 hypothetical protein PPERSA_00025 [Pseudocohnilembus persalinus]
MNLDQSIQLKACYYIPDYLTEKDKQNFMKSLEQTPLHKWEILQKANRRLQKWGGDVTPQGLQNQEKLPQFMQIIVDKIHEQSQITQYKPNHILLNEYPPQVGIMPHTDGPLYIPFVCSITFGCNALFKFYKNYQDYKDKKFAVQLVLEDNCLCVFTQDLYENYLHCLEDIPIEYIYLDLKEIDGWDEGQKEIVVQNCDTANFLSTNLYKKLKSFSSLEMAVQAEFLMPVKIQENEKQEPQYNYAIELKREKQRISLTIRHVKNEIEKIQ